MKKHLEISNPSSCLNRARAEELIFVIRAHDIASPHTVRRWARKRIKLGKNSWSDPQIREALEWADTVEAQHEKGTV